MKRWCNVIARISWRRRGGGNLRLGHVRVCPSDTTTRRSLSNAQEGGGGRGGAERGSSRARFTRSCFGDFCERERTRIAIPSEESESRVLPCCSLCLALFRHQLLMSSERTNERRACACATTFGGVRSEIDKWCSAAAAMSLCLWSRRERGQAQAHKGPFPVCFSMSIEHRLLICYTLFQICSSSNHTTNII